MKEEEWKGHPRPWDQPGTERACLSRAPPASGLSGNASLMPSQEARKSLSQAAASRTGPWGPSAQAMSLPRRAGRVARWHRIPAWPYISHR